MTLHNDTVIEIVAATFARIRAAIFQRILESTKLAASGAGVAIGRRNKVALQNALKRVVAVDVFASEPWLKPVADQWIAENVSLVRSVSEDSLNELEKVIYRQIRGGGSMKDTQIQ